MKKLFCLIIISALSFTFACTGKGKIIVISDKRCKECNTTGLDEKLKQDFPDAIVEQYDYSDTKGREIYTKANLDKLPAILFTKEMEKSKNYEKVKKFTIPQGDYLAIRVGASFDPKAEICDNNMDDNNDGKVDCGDPSCKSNWLCMEKRDKPTADIFVMSHCPFGTQIEKGLLSVWKALKDKADINIRFCNYAMHGKKEIDEELRQYCIQKDSKDKFIAYLECFLDKGEEGSCLKKANVNTTKLSACIKASDNKFNVTKSFDDKSKWMGRFPPFYVDDDLNKKYGVGGSPTVVINDVQARVGRSPSELLNAICKGFKTPPSECTEKLSGQTYSPGFGWKEEAGAGGAASCGS